MSARGPIHAMLPPLDNPADVEAREEEMNRRLDDHRAEVLAEVTAWLVKKAREFRAGGTRADRAQADTVACMASKIDRGAVRPNNLRMLPDPGFFETDRTYRRNANTFRVLVLDPHPVTGQVWAIGWMTGPERCLVTRLDQRDWDSGKWTDTTEEVAR